ncbi:HEAT repeat domain-containing protein [Chryseobacterium nematophagum]|nr:HEAT repeat domain-containing protein [Chryseobacterium nematophagum]
MILIFITSVHFLFLAFLGMLSLVLLLIMVVLSYGFAQYAESVRVFRWSEIINKKILEVIVYDKDELPPNDTFAAFSHDSSFRDLLLKILTNSERKFSGVAKNKIRDLFQEYNLEKEALKKLEQKKKYLIAGGIQELTAMHADKAASKISLFLTFPFTPVYQEAQYAMVYFKGFDGLDFLDTTTTKISEWQQLRLLLSISDIPVDHYDNVEKWLESTNESVIIFTLRLLRKFQILSFYPIILKLLDHPSIEVRKQVVQTLLSLENSSTIKSLVEAYPEQEVEVQLEMLKAMKISKDQCCVDFLKEQLWENPLSGIKINAAEALFLLGHKEYLLQMVKDESLSEELIQILKYALQEKPC